MFLVPNIDQMYKEMKKIVEIENGDEFPDFAILGGKKQKNPDLPTLILKTMQSETHFFFFFGLNKLKNLLVQTKFYWS
jgi:hypothetical protein